MIDIPDDRKYSKYSDYILENYIDENSKFPPSMWTSHSATLNRTTNNCNKKILNHFLKRDMPIKLYRRSSGTAIKMYGMTP
ncbi:Uncharacterized protein FWK35_00034240, partial [Aphis craccivora]